MNETPRQPGKRVAGLSNRGEETADSPHGLTWQIPLSKLRRLDLAPAAGCGRPLIQYP
jgi:hypothetical protein